MSIRVVIDGDIITIQPGASLDLTLTLHGVSLADRVAMGRTVLGLEGERELLRQWEDAR